ncbi:hypothetical protein, partial [Aneurinibacillus migulanus]|uniref:hypothetical protein n=1 Tax=Aneurinibacillus migulanus TaxID=47500 RepID=UPI001C3F6D36
MERRNENCKNLNSDEIIRIIVYESRALSTSKEIQDEDSKEKIIHAYKNNFYKRVEQGFNIYIHLIGLSSAGAQG